MDSVDDLDGGTATLYVGDLCPEVEDTILFEKFSKIGQLLDIRVPTDNSTGQSLGYAYVTYLQSADAERAWEAMNGEKIAGKPCRIMWAQSNADGMGAVGKVFVRNLDASVDDQLLRETFSVYGDVMFCKVAMDDDNQSKGYGTVHLATGTAAREAIDDLDQTKLKGKVISVEHYLSRRDRQEAMETQKNKTQYTNIYVKHFSDHVTDDKFAHVFRKFGTISSIKIEPAKQPGLSRFAFIQFDKHEQAKNCVESLHGMEVAGLTAEGQTLHVQPFKNKEERTVELQNKSYEGVNLYVSNLDDDIDEERLEKEFACFGNIINVTVMRNEKNRSRGFGFVRFSTDDEAIRAISEMDGRILVERPLNVSLHQKKNERKSRLAAQYMDRMAQTLRDQQLQQPSRPAVNSLGSNKELFDSFLHSRMAPAATSVPEGAHEPAPKRPGQKATAVQSHVPEQQKEQQKQQHEKQQEQQQEKKKEKQQEQEQPQEQPQEQKQILAGRLISLMGKITSMLPHIDNSELRTMLDYNEHLLEKFKTGIAARGVEKDAVTDVTAKK